MKRGRLKRRTLDPQIRLAKEDIQQVEVDITLQKSNADAEGGMWTILFLVLRTVYLSVTANRKAKVASTTSETWILYSIERVGESRKERYKPLAWLTYLLPLLI